MSKSQIRKDKTCLNCNYVVDQRYCPNCGQENTDSRKTFHHLFFHFFEDLTHYENAFWKTIRNLLFKPASLTKEYLSGRRLSYLAPVRLYIFISFITFLVITMMASGEEFHDLPLAQMKPKPGTKLTKNELEEIREIDLILAKQKRIDSLRVAGWYNKDEADLMKQSLEDNFSSFGLGENMGYKSMREMDSVQKSLPTAKRYSQPKYWLYSKITMLRERRLSGEEIATKFKESFLHNFPKVLFIYMPIFAFFLWLFHSKKRWYYFDHGIFTLHYFSFLLLVSLIAICIDGLLGLLHSDIAEIVSRFVFFILVCWMIYYIFPAHHRFYGETRTLSFFKTLVLFFINSLIIIAILSLFALYTFVNIH
ncbi:hypothetical protein HYN48_10310 [Flavobacterium magnum]|uniref:DUF3667 domain-containing protein n=1 Tax=Flavobacterium magnum TaxID=2162713 RepID=A0A2S0RES9_9FLAO|nr:DUF3667 domain-containing protein [Flavobacterium magnum]AWA30447.1 hypothetical protein HYN48_10310 [Flavobacterium magnum]